METRIYCCPHSSGFSDFTGTHEEMLLKKISLIFEICHGQISREELSLLMGYNSDYLNRLVKRQTGMSLMTFGQQFCLLEAERLLRESSITISEISAALGFSNRSYFYHLFKHAFGVKPGEYRRLHSFRI